MMSNIITKRRGEEKPLKFLITLVEEDGGIPHTEISQDLYVRFRPGVLGRFFAFSLFDDSHWIAVSPFRITDFYWKRVDSGWVNLKRPFNLRSLLLDYSIKQEKSQGKPCTDLFFVDFSQKSRYSIRVTGWRVCPSDIER